MSPKDVDEGSIPCPNLSVKSLNVKLIEAGLNSGVTQTQRKKWGRLFAEFLYQNVSGDFIASMDDRLQELKEKDANSLARAIAHRRSPGSFGGPSFTDGIRL